MKQVKDLMINDYKVMQLGYDFMGYQVKRKQDLSFHHTLFSRSFCNKNGLGDGYWEWNGSILVQRSSHDYLHYIKRFDEDRFYAITSELFDENIKGRIDKDNIRAIHDILDSFEREYDVPREEYVKRLKI